MPSGISGGHSIFLQSRTNDTLTCAVRSKEVLESIAMDLGEYLLWRCLERY